MSYSSIQNIPGEAVRRAPTGLPEIDWLYGYSSFPGKPTQWGLPEGKISLWSGASGVGKSRVAIEVAKSYVKGGVSVLYFQNEVDESTFSEWVKRGSPCNMSKFYYSGSITLEDQIRDIEALNPTIIFVDSINMVKEFKSGTKVDIEKIMERFRFATMGKSRHVIFISQLNKDGGIKGSSTLSHLVDIAIGMDLYGPDSFSIYVGHKHRYGRTGPDFYSIWKHTNSGIEYKTERRLKDPVWCQTHGVRVHDEAYYREVYKDLAPKPKGLIRRVLGI